MTSKADAIKYLPANLDGRDFVVGDIHGCYELLEQQLDRHGFDERRDRLLALGDLVDRGPESLRALEYLDKPWFHSIIGNHEDMMLHWLAPVVEAGASKADKEVVWSLYQHVENGGRWALDLLKSEKGADRSRLWAFYEAFARLPLAIEMENPEGARVGLVHADVPPHSDWRRFKEELARGQEQARQVALWSRRRIQRLISGEEAQPIEGVDRLYLGHTILRGGFEAANLRYIDTGAFYTGVLTVESVDSVFATS